MFKNYIKSAIRALLKYKGTTLINILGLTIGLCSVILISVYVYSEVSYDKFHEKSDRIYRIGVQGKMMGNDLDMAVTSSVMTGPLLDEYPEVENVARVYRNSSQMVSYEDKTFHESASDFLFVDSTFFDVFSFRLLEGNPSQVLTDPFSIVITKKIAQKFFGNENPIGKSLMVNSKETIYRVTGLVEEAPANSHFHFQYLAALHGRPELKRDNWLSHNFYTYVLLKPGSDAEHFTQSLSSLLDKYIAPMLLQFLNLSLEDFYAQGSTFEYISTKLTDIHLNSHQQYEIEPTGNKSYVYIFSALALLILIVASINFVNLATARSANRAKEVGIRKLSGSTKSALVVQFLIESTILSLISLIVAVVLAALLIPAFNNIIQSTLRFNPFSSWAVSSVLLALGILVGILAGIYPAVRLAAVRPVRVLKGIWTGTEGKGRLRKVLVILQFAVTLIIITCTTTAYRQLSYMQHKDIGFNKKNVLIVNSGHFLGTQYEAFRSELLKHSGVVQVGRSYHVPGSLFSNNAHWLEGHGVDEIFTLMETSVSYEWDEIMGLEMVQGRFFDKNMGTDSMAVIVNEAALRELNIDNPLETRFYEPSEEGSEVVFHPIIGVVKDFHIESMQQPIGPVILNLVRQGSYGEICIRVEPESKQEVLQLAQNTWNSMTSGFPLDSFWLEDFFDEIFKGEKQTSQILLIFSFLSILISCLGLLGLISFATLQRTREIAVRKTFGSSASQIVFLLFRETYVLLAISTLLAIPSFYLINRWMQNFAYKIEFGLIAFGITLLSVAIFLLIIAAGTISQEAIRAARTNPSRAFRQ